MKPMKAISGLLAATLLSGCASMNGASGPRGPKITSSGYTTETGQYAEIGIEFSSPGDFFSLVSPKRWKSPLATGGTLSWLNPEAWREDFARTGRILIGEAITVGGVAIAASSGGGGGGGGDSSAATTEGSNPAGPGDPPSVPSGTPIP